MDTAREQVLLLISTPIYAFVIGLEMLLSSIHHRKWYSAKGTLANIYLSALNFGLDLVMLSVCLGLLALVGKFQFFSIADPWAYWITLLVAEDLMFYLLHYIDHYCRFF